MPAFLAGALAVQITEDLRFGAAGLGLAVATYRAAGAATSPPMGRVADRLGVTRSLRVASAIAIVAAVGLATTASGLPSLMAWLALAACSNSLAQPSANRLLVRQVRAERRGLAFGIKQSAPPTASMLAGLSVPTIALTLGWRWAFALGAILAVGVMLSTARQPQASRQQRRAAPPARRLRADGRLLMTLGVSFGLATAASSPVAAFYVPAAVHAGSPPQTAGIMLAVASLCAIGVRLASGVACDFIGGRHLRLCAALVATGSLGALLLSTGNPAAMTVGAVIAMGGGWGFNAVFWFTMMRAFPDVPGTVTGALQPGGLIGATIGPVTFGLLVEQAGYQVSWAVLACVAAIAGAGMAYSARRVP